MSVYHYVNFCTECGTKTQSMSYPDDDRRCPKEDCPKYNKVVEYYE